MPSQTITASDTIDGVPVTTTTTVPEYATDSITISHDVSLGAQDNSGISISRLRSTHPVRPHGILAAM